MTLRRGSRYAAARRLNPGIRLLSTFVVAGALLATGCASRATPATARPARPPVPVFVLRPSWATSPEPFAADAAPLVRGLSEGGGLLPRAVAADAACADEPACLDGALAGLPDGEVLVVRLAALADTVLVRASLVHRRFGTTGAARQEVVHDATEARVRDALQALGAALAAPYAPPRPPPPPPLVRTPWFWAVVAGGLAASGAAVGAAVWASQPRPDVVITPP